jgi:DNA polymerase-3 subunit gamma/tau
LAYQVIARKWRPQSFSELMGQEHVAQTLYNALKSNRMPHALLFTGPRGVGKTSAARILAKSLRCQNAKDFVPCNECDDCLEITAGNALDVIEIDGASNNGVENIRELRETIGYMPSRGKYKIYIIDEVHMLSTSAFNALLKTLEEPPPHVIFIFATTEVQKIPATILSRCQRFDFRRIPVRKVVERLKTIIDAEGVTAEPQALWLMGRESEGSMRDSQSLLDQVITFCGKNITHDKVVDILGLTDRTLLGHTLLSIIDRNTPECLEIIKKVFHLGYDPKQFAQDLLGHIRNLMIVKVSAQLPDYLDLPDEEVQELKKFSLKVSDEDVHLLFDMTLKGVTDVVRAQDPRIVLEMLLLRLSQAPRLTSIDALMAHLNGEALPQKKSEPVKIEAVAPIPAKITATVAQNPLPAQTPTPVTVTATIEVAPVQNVDRTWPGLINSIKKDKPLLGAKLEYAALKNLDDSKISLSFRKEQEFFYNQMNTKEILDQLMDLVGKHWGRPYQVEIHLAKPGETLLSPQEERDRVHKEGQEATRAKIEAHPMVREAQAKLNAKITSIKESK